MKLRPALLTRFSIALTLVCVLQAAGSAEISVTGDGSNSAKNLARLNCGAHIERILPGGRINTFVSADSTSGSPGALLLDDNTLSCPLSLGDNTFIVSFPRTSLLQRCAFIDRNAVAQGEFEVAVSNYRLGSGETGWKNVLAPTVFGKDSIINVPMLAVEARYVRLTFHVKKEGHLSALALYGTPTLDSFSRVNTLKAETNFSVGALSLVTHLEDTLNFNYANSYAQGRVAYVSSGGPNSPRCMIDDDASTSFTFSADDPHPTVIVALATRETLHRISALSGTPDGKVDIYLLDELGSDPSDLSEARHIGSVASRTRAGEIVLNFQSQKARYIALRWNPEHRSNQSQKVDVSEIGIFGTVPMAVVNLTEEYAQLSNPGEGTHEVSNGLGTLAIPPEVPPTSP